MKMPSRADLYRLIQAQQVAIERLNRLAFCDVVGKWVLVSTSEWLQVVNDIRAEMGASPTTLENCSPEVIRKYISGYFSGFAADPNPYVLPGTLEELRSYIASQVIRDPFKQEIALWN